MNQASIVSNSLLSAISEYLPTKQQVNSCKTIKLNTYRKNADHDRSRRQIDKSYKPPGGLHK